MAESQKGKILRIGVIQGGKIIEEKLIRKRSSVTVGTNSRNTLVLSAADVPKSFSLFEMRGNDYYLAFDDNMTGRVSVADQAADLQSLKAQNLVKKSGSLYHLKLNEGSRGRVSVGACIILFQFVAPPPEPVRPMLPASVKGYWTKNIDWPYTSTFGAVAATFLFIVVWAKSSPLPKEPSLEDIPDRFAKMVMPDKEAPKKDENGEGAGKDDPKPEKKKAKEPDEDLPPDDAGGDDEEAKAAKAAQKRAAMEKKVSGRGLLKILGAKGPGGLPGGSAVADVFSEGSVGDGTGAFDGVGGGFDVATASGQRGSRGGDGAGEEASIGELGTRGVVGGAGQGTGRKAEAQVVARVTSAAMQEFDSDSRSQDDIKKMMRRRLGGIKRCYEKRLKRNPELRGKVVIRFVIHPGGKVIEVEVVENTSNDPELAACIKSIVKGIRFGATEGSETVVTYPFILAPGG
jgi:outer membrane biosynthesis protein TonB